MSLCEDTASSEAFRSSSGGEGQSREPVPPGRCARDTAAETQRRPFRTPPEGSSHDNRADARKRGEVLPRIDGRRVTGYSTMTRAGTGDTLCLRCRMRRPRATLPGVEARSRGPPPEDGTSRGSDLVRGLRLPAVSGETNVNDPSAGSPTETLLRLLLPLDSQVRSSSRPAHGGPKAPAGPIQGPH